MSSKGWVHRPAVERLLAGNGVADDLLYAFSWSHSALGCDHWDNRFHAAIRGDETYPVKLTAEERADIEKALAEQPEGKLS